MENIHISAPIHLAGCRQFNAEVADILRTYGFPVTMAQEVLDEAVINQTAEDWHARRLDYTHQALKTTKILMLIEYPGVPDAFSPMEIEMAVAQYVHIIGVRNAFSLDYEALGMPMPEESGSALLSQCGRWFDAKSTELDHLMNPLMSFVNLYY